MNIKELRDKSSDDLNEELKELLREQFNLRMQKATGKVAKPHLFRVVRRTMARIKTILRERVGDK